jgi:hypothetical protein
MSKHTHGPWQVGIAYDNDGETEITIEHMTPHGDYIVAIAIGGLEGQEANARLIAAAPDLLFQLLSASNYIDALGGDSKGYRAAIAKATGGEE